MFRRVIRYSCVVWICFSILSRSARAGGVDAGDANLRDEILNAVSRRQESIRSIDVRYTDVSRDPLDPSSDRTYDQEVHFVTDFKMIYMDVVNKNATDSSGSLPHQRLVYDGDGKRIVELRPEDGQGARAEDRLLWLGIVRAVDPTRKTVRFGCAYLNCQGIFYPDPSRRPLTAEDYQTRRSFFAFEPIPWLLDRPRCLLRRDAADDGRECVVIENAGWQEDWLAPSLDYAVVKKVIYEAGSPAWIQLSKDFVQVDGVAYLPKRIDYFEVNRATRSREKYGEFFITYFHAFSLKHAKFNRVKEARDLLRQRVRIKPGSLVMDTRFGPIESSGAEVEVEEGRVVGYRQPVDENDVDAAVRQAQLRMGESILRERWLKYRRVIIVLTYLFVFMGLAFMLWRRGRKQARPMTS